MTEKTQVHVQVGKEQKEKWDRAQRESTNYANLSDLVRQAVEAELNEDDDSSPATDGRQLDEIRSRLEKLERIESTVNSIDGRLRDVYDEVRYDPERSELASQILQILPEESELIDGEMEYRPGEGPHWIDEAADLKTGERKAVPLSEINESELARTGRVEAFAEILGEDVRRVEEAIQQLRENTYVVEQTDDGAYYHRED